MDLNYELTFHDPAGMLGYLKRPSGPHEDDEGHQGTEAYQHCFGSIPVLCHHFFQSNPRACLHDTFFSPFSYPVYTM